MPRIGDVVNQQNVGVGTFRDVQALIEHGTRGGHFAHVSRLRDHQHLIDLGGNALELLPPADTFVDRRSWGYATSNYFAPDFDLLLRLGNSRSAQPGGRIRRSRMAGDPAREAVAGGDAGSFGVTREGGARAAVSLGGEGVRAGMTGASHPWCSPFHSSE
jgi:hypothetical protein